MAIYTKLEDKIPKTLNQGKGGKRKTPKRLLNWGKEKGRSTKIGSLTKKINPIFLVLNLVSNSSKYDDHMEYRVKSDFENMLYVLIIC